MQSPLYSSWLEYSALTQRPGFESRQRNFFIFWSNGFFLFSGPTLFWVFFCHMYFRFSLHFDASALDTSVLGVIMGHQVTNAFQKGQEKKKDALLPSLHFPFASSAEKAQPTTLRDPRLRPHLHRLCSRTAAAAAKAINHTTGPAPRLPSQA